MFTPMKIEIEHEGSCLGATGETARLVTRQSLCRGRAAERRGAESRPFAGWWESSAHSMCIAAADRHAVDCAIASASLRMRSVDISPAHAFKFRITRSYRKLIRDRPIGQKLHTDPPIHSMPILRHFPTWK